MTEPSVTQLRQVLKRVYAAAIARVEAASTQASTTTASTQTPTGYLTIRQIVAEERTHNPEYYRTMAVFCGLK